MADTASGVVADQILDVTGLGCPLPILKARKALASLAAGAVLDVRATDPGSVADFQAFCGLSGHTLIAQSAVTGIYQFLIRKGPA